MKDTTYLINLFSEIRERGVEGLLSGDTEGTSSKIDEALEMLERNSDIAKKALFERMDEKSLVLFMLMVQKMVSTLAIKNGDKSIMLAEMSGELQAYTQTAILATIGTLMADEIL